MGKTKGKVMDTQDIKENGPETVDGRLILLPPPQIRLLAAPKEQVSDSEFETVVRGALEAVGGTMLFKVRIDAENAGHHAAAAAVGTGDTRQFLLLTLPLHGGSLKVETTASSSSPLAGIAASYAGLMDIFRAAA